MSIGSEWKDNTIITVLQMILHIKFVVQHVVQSQSIQLKQKLNASQNRHSDQILIQN
jgi:hypothetical protein